MASMNKVPETFDTSAASAKSAPRPDDITFSATSNSIAPSVEVRHSVDCGMHCARGIVWDMYDNCVCMNMPQHICRYHFMRVNFNKAKIA